MSSTQAIRERLRDAGATFAANDNIAEYLLPGDTEVIQAEVEQHVQAVLEALVIDTSRDHNTKATAKRIVRMYVREVFAGRFESAPEVTDFPNACGLNELYAGSHCRALDVLASPPTHNRPHVGWRGAR
ncbi:hypothetical protein ACVSQB_37565 [Bradyrhizobium elkanii]